MLVKFLLCGLASLSIGLKSAKVEASSSKDGSYINGRFYRDSFLDKVINNLDNVDNSVYLDKTQNTLNGENSVDVVVELYDNSVKNNSSVNGDNFDEIKENKKVCIKNENERIFNLLNLENCQSYCKCENIPFLVYKYNEVYDFYKSDFYKISNYDAYIKNVFIEREEYSEEANRNSGNVHDYSYSDALIDVGIPTVKTFDGTGINIGSIEPGIPDNYVNFQHTYYEINGSELSQHCFETASIYGGDNGIASGANLYFYGLRNNKSFTQAFDWLIGHEVNVVNCSFGFTNEDGTYSSMCAIADYVVQNYKITVVKSAGNRGRDSGLLTTPGNGLNVISVGSVSLNNAISCFSSSKLNSSYSPLLFKPTLVAPGDGLDGVPNTSEDLTGTSYAAPFVTGIVALLMQEYPDLKYHPEKVMSILTDSCTSVSGQESFEDHDAGFGLVNYGNAREACSNTFDFQIGANQKSNSVLFSKTINVPAGKTLLASSDVLYNPVNNTNYLPDQLRHSKINTRIKTNDYEYTLTGVSKSNISYVSYTNDTQQNQSFILEAFLDGAKNNDFVENCSLSYRIFTNYDEGLIIPGSPFEIMHGNSFFEKQITIAGNEYKDLWYSSEYDNTYMFHLFGNLNGVEIKLFDARNNLLDTRDSSDENGNFFVKSTFNSNEQYRIRIINKTNSSKVLKLGIFSVYYWDPVIHNIYVDANEARGYGQASSNEVEIFNVSVSQTGYYSFSTPNLHGVKIRLFIFDRSSNSLVDDEDIASFDYWTTHAYFLKKLEKGKNYIVVAGPEVSISFDLLIESRGRELGNANENGGYYNTMNLDNAQNGVYIPRRSSNVAFDLSSMNGNRYNTFDMRLYNMDTGSYEDVYQETTSTDRRIKTYHLLAGSRYSVTVFKNSGSWENGNLKLFISYSDITINFPSSGTNARYMEKTQLLYPGEEVSYSITFAKSGTQIFQTFGQKDTYIKLYDNRGYLVASDDNSGYENNAFIKRNVDANTTYRVVVSLKNSYDTGYVKTSVTPFYNGYSWMNDYDSLGNSSNIGSNYSIGLNLNLNCSTIRTITVNTSGNYRFDLKYTNAKIDTYIHVINPNSPSALTNNDYNDDGGEDNQAQLTKYLTAGVKYYVICSAYYISTASGSVNLFIRKV